MPYQFESTNDSIQSIETINIMLIYAKKEAEDGNEISRNLFLKLSIVYLVTKLQVYIENVLKEFLFLIKSSEIKNENIFNHMRLNSIKLYLSNNDLLKELQNPESYSLSKFELIKSGILEMHKFVQDSHNINRNFTINTKFPLGKTGTNDLLKLFAQIDGENFFEKTSIDQNKLDEILGRRNAIVHEDNNPQITEETVSNYKDFIKNLMAQVDSYLMSFYTQFKESNLTT